MRTQNFFPLFPNVINAHFLCSTIIHISPKKEQVSCPCSKEFLKSVSPGSRCRLCCEPVNSVIGDAPKTRGEGRILGRQLSWALPHWLVWVSRNVISAHLIIHCAKHVSTRLRAESFNLGSKALQRSMWLHPNPCTYFTLRSWAVLKIIRIQKRATFLKVGCEGWPGDALLRYGDWGELDEAVACLVVFSLCRLAHDRGGERVVAGI